MPDKTNYFTEFYTFSPVRATVRQSMTSPTYNNIFNNNKSGAYSLQSGVPSKGTHRVS